MIGTATRRTVTALTAGLLPGCMLLDSLIFFPSRGAPPPPSGIEERWFRSRDGVRLHAWYAPPPSAAAPVLVWSHGNGGNVAGRQDVLLALAARGLGVLAYDYRGYGKSEGKPNESGVYLDAEAAFDDERALGTPAGRIVCFGESLGGAVSIRLASVRPCAAVAVVSSFPRLRDVARTHYGPLAALAGNRFDSASLVGELQIPFFAAHGDRDEIVPYELGEQLFALASEPKHFLPVPGFHHNDIFGSRELLDALARFCRESVSAAP